MWAAKAIVFSKRMKNKYRPQQAQHLKAFNSVCKKILQSKQKREKIEPLHKSVFYSKGFSDQNRGHKIDATSTDRLSF